MAQARKTRPKRGKKSDKPDIYAERRKKELEQEAENRRKLLAKLDPKTRKYAIEQFAMLGLHQ